VIQLPKIPISVLIQTKNEEVGIVACLESLADFDEVIVVDSDSTDRTVELALAHGASVVNFTWNHEYPKKKQWQLEHLATRHEWVLFMDADESPTPELLRSLREFGASSAPSQFAAFDLRLEYVFVGKTLAHGHRVVKRALVRKDRVAFPIVDDLNAPGMGELEGHYQPHASGKVGTLRGRIRHDDKDPVRTWFDRHNRYSDWEAYLRTQPATKARVAENRSRQGQLFDKIPFKPILFFTYGYVVRGGFLDGRAGLDYALALSFYYWQIELKTREQDRTDHSERNANVRRSVAS
jgi:glycosyltransferase involved in cell wall biosynthesis